MRRAVMAAAAVPRSIVRRLPPALRQRVRDTGHRVRLRMGIDPLARPEEHTDFLIRHLATLDLTSGANPQYVEFGVYQGASMSAAVRAFDTVGLRDASFVGFDSFQGLPLGSEREGWGSGWFATSRAVTEWNLARHGVRDRVRLVDGWFDDTCTPELAEDLGAVHVAMIDCDIYSASDTAMRFVEPLLADPCLIVFDDFYGMNHTGDRSIGQARVLAEFEARHHEARIEWLGRVGLEGMGFRVSGHAAADAAPAAHAEERGVGTPRR